ncbi:nicotinamide/nicotinic acid mononucleotide adenylyltransferase 3 isoform X2 [Condylostylus longicornis]|uniref:nicotinamide/nicotinic acid mononucleotide adenylyltransferase 3 isoform X2 n=1 Tax=Condylostylus longicornis TaxID=2530218 RepID=UPI00244DA7D8|nr:nicotinamide/nicotinic acid mononucleotide adenylyltransferase 3 isoform X2 [Condylostylus longicornis]
METLRPKLVIIACGSYSPITPMHLRMFEIAKDYFERTGLYEVIGGIISPTHDDYGKVGLVPAVHRCTMIKLATRSSSWIRLSDWEIQQSQWSRTRQVLQYHKNFMNNFIKSPNSHNEADLPEWLPKKLSECKHGVHLKLLCGADLLESFNVPNLWKDEDIEEIVGNYGLIVVSRSGSNPERFIFDSDLLSKLKFNISLITNWVPNEISSSVIRRLISRGESVKYLIDDAVIEYINRNGLFKTANTKTSKPAIENDVEKNVINITKNLKIANRKRKKKL